MIVSIKEEAQPEMQPYVMPITVAMKLLAMPIRSEVLPPFQSTEKISRPKESVPNQNSLFGASFKWER